MWADPKWARDTITQLTFDPGDDVVPIWTPDSKRIVFASDRAKAGTHNVSEPAHGRTISGVFA